VQSRGLMALTGVSMGGLVKRSDGQFDRHRLQQIIIRTAKPMVTMK
jgi:hypothetical protein